MNNEGVARWCRGVEVVICACVILIPLLGQITIWLIRHPVPHTYVYGELHLFLVKDYLVISLRSLVEDAIQSFILWQFIPVFRSIRKGTVFTKNIVRRLRYAGLGFIFTPVFKCLGELIQVFLLNNETFTLLVNDLNYCLVGSGLIILSHVIASGKMLQDEYRFII